MNTRAKGRRNELKCKKALEAEGYRAIIAPTPQRWQKAKDGGTDFFGLFDLIAIKSQRIRFVQVKTNVDDTGKAWKNDARAFCELSGSTVEIWIYTDRIKDPHIKVL